MPVLCMESLGFPCQEGKSPPDSDIYISFSPNQHGFHSRQSFLSNFLLQEEPVTRLMDAGHTGDLVYLDFKKEFDFVNHRFLLAKRKSSGIDGPVLNWIKSYLSD